MNKVDFLSVGEGSPLPKGNKKIKQNCLNERNGITSTFSSGEG